MPRIIHFGKQCLSLSVCKQVKVMSSNFIVLKLHMNIATYFLARIYYILNYSLLYFLR